MAKLLLFATLKKIDDNGFDNCIFEGLQWRKNYGVFMNLPFYTSDDPYYFESSKGLIPHDIRGNNPLEWFDPLYNRGELLFTSDIVIFHKGMPSIFIEVVEPHWLVSEKAAKIQSFFGKNTVSLYQVDATNILLCSSTIENIDFLKWNI